MKLEIGRKEGSLIGNGSEYRTLWDPRKSPDNVKFNSIHSILIVI